MELEQKFKEASGIALTLSLSFKIPLNRKLLAILKILYFACSCAAKYNKATNFTSLLNLPLQTIAVRVNLTINLGRPNFRIMSVRVRKAKFRQKLQDDEKFYAKRAKNQK